MRVLDTKRIHLASKTNRDFALVLEAISNLLISREGPAFNIDSNTSLYKALKD